MIIIETINMPSRALAPLDGARGVDAAAAGG